MCEAPSGATSWPTVSGLIKRMSGRFEAKVEHRRAQPPGELLGFPIGWLSGKREQQGWSSNRRLNVRFWHKADILNALTNVRFWVESGHGSLISARPKPQSAMGH